MARAQPPTWKVSSPGADGVEGTEDDLTSGNAPELKIFFNTVRGDYAVPARRRFETLFVHLPLIGDETLKRLWEAYPQHRPTDEEKLYEYWRSYKGDQFFYRAEDPRDAEKGHGAELAKKIAPAAKATLVPAKDVFPASLDVAKKDEEPKKDEPKTDEPKTDEPTKEEAPPEDAADRKTFLEKGWREIVIRELFLENLLNDVLTRCRESHLAVSQATKKLAAWEQERAAYEQALADWEKANAGKPEADRAPKPTEPMAEKPVVPAQVTFESVLAGELKELVTPSEAGGVPAIQYWQTPTLMSREEWEKNENFGDGLQFELSRLKEDGEYNGIPAQLHRRLTKVLVRRLEFKDREPQEYEDVKDKVFDRFVELRQMDRAADALKKLQADAQAAISALGSEANDEQKQETWDGVRTAWSEKLGNQALLESTGLFIGNVPPPPVEVEAEAPAQEKARLERRNYVWRAGYATVRPVDSKQDTVTAEPGTFGRSVLRDPVVDEKGTGYAFLIRVAERVYPSKDEFSPRRYTEHLSTVVFGDRSRMGRQRRLADHEGAIFKALDKWFGDIAWLKSTFDLQTNSDINKLEKDKNR